MTNDRETNNYGAAAAKSLQSCPTLATSWTAAHQVPSSMGFSRQKYWSGVPLPSLNYIIELGKYLLVLDLRQSMKI